MASPNTGDILSMRLGDIKDIPPIPVGTYAATITSIPKIDNFGQAQKPGVEFSFKLTAPQDDVDAEALAEAGGLPEAPLTYTFWRTSKAAGIFRSFLVDVLGFSEDEKPQDALMQVQGMEALVTIEHNTWKGRTSSRIRGFAKA